jgi:cytochrome c biogenesis protein CcmG/thiol:disulfide interchange protein DsbE
MDVECLGFVVRRLPRRTSGAGRAVEIRLARFGDPYLLSAYDIKGKVGIDYGVYGVPETYVIDKQGVIRYKRIGIVTPDIVKSKILPLVSELNREK